MNAGWLFSYLLSGVVQLVSPLRDATAEASPRGSLAARVVYYAKRHARQHPREIGGQNRGPWVRVYMDGEEGPDWPWCAGFVSFVLKQASDSAEQHPPLALSVSCDSLAASAKARGIFLAGRTSNYSRIKPGDLFLNRRTSTDWTHVGVVIKTAEEVFMSIEGNTNDEGGREGYEVCSRIRGYKRKDFISIPG